MKTCWFGARTACEDLSGRLAVLNTQQKIQELTAYATGIGYGCATGGRIIKLALDETFSCTMS